MNPNHALDVFAGAGAPWWGIGILIILLATLWRGPALIRELNNFLKTQRQLSHRHQQNMHKLRSSIAQRTDPKAIKGPKTPKGPTR